MFTSYHVAWWRASVLLCCHNEINFLLDMQCTTLTSVYALFLCLYRTALYGIYNGLTKTFETVWFLMSGYGIYCLIRWGNYSSLSCLNLQDRTGYDGRAMGWCSTPILATGWQWGFKTWRSVMTSRVFGKEARNWKKNGAGRTLQQTDAHSKTSFVTFDLPCRYWNRLFGGLLWTPLPYW